MLGREAHLCEERIKMPIFDSAYQIRMRYIDTMSPEELSLYGQIITGDQAIDSSYSKQYITTVRSIYQLAQLMEDNIPFFLLEPNAPVEIYNSLENYIKYWVKTMDMSLSTAMAPLEDLIILDELASKVYPHAKPLFKKERSTGPASKALAGLSGGRKHDKFTAMPQGFKDNLEENKKNEEHDSYDSLFKAYLTR